MEYKVSWYAEHAKQNMDYKVSCYVEHGIQSITLRRTWNTKSLKSKGSYTRAVWYRQSLHLRWSCCSTWWVPQGYSCTQSQRALMQYHWRELPQVSFLLQQKFCRDELVFVATNTCLSQQNTSFVVSKVCLPWQNCVCHDKVFLSRQTRVCRYKHAFVTTKDMFCCDTHVCHDKSRLVTTKLCLLWQKFCCNKNMFVATNTYLSGQKWYLWQLPPMITHELCRMDKVSTCCSTWWAPQ